MRLMSNWGRGGGIVGGGRRGGGRRGGMRGVVEGVYCIGGLAFWRGAVGYGFRKGYSLLIYRWDA